MFGPLEYLISYLIMRIFSFFMATWFILVLCLFHDLIFPLIIFPSIYYIQKSWVRKWRRFLV